MTAFHLRKRGQDLRGLDDEDLKQVPVVPMGTRLQQGATYVDLNEARLRAQGPGPVRDLEPADWGGEARTIRGFSRTVPTDPTRIGRAAGGSPRRDPGSPRRPLPTRVWVRR